MQLNDIILAAGLNSRATSSILSADAALRRTATALRRALRALQTTRAGPEEKRGKTGGGLGVSGVQWLQSQKRGKAGHLGGSQSGGAGRASKQHRLFFS